MKMKKEKRIIICINEGTNRCPCGLESICGTIKPEEDSDILQMIDNAEEDRTHVWFKAIKEKLVR